MSDCTLSVSVESKGRSGVGKGVKIEHEIIRACISVYVENGRGQGWGEMMRKNHL